MEKSVFQAELVNRGRRVQWCSKWGLGWWLEAPGEQLR